MRQVGRQKPPEVEFAQCNDVNGINEIDPMPTLGSVECGRRGIEQITLCSDPFDEAAEFATTQRQAMPALLMKLCS
jgi:hypothetical protein